MYEKLRIAIAQAEASIADPEGNTRKIKEWIKTAVDKGANMICFPELFYSAYDVNAEELKRCAIGEDDVFFQDLKALAKEYEINILVSYPEKSKEGKPYISFAYIDSNGTLICNHRKSYLWLGEKEKVTPGEPVYKVLDTPFGKIGLLICYEIEFPEPVRILTLKGAEIIISTMAFDLIEDLQKYISAMGVLNQVYAIGVNGCAPDKEFCRGKSCISDQWGNIVFALDEGKEQLGLYEIDLEKQNRRNDSPHKKDFLKDTLQQLAQMEEWK